MCGRYSLAPDQSKEIAQIVAEVQARFGAASIHTGEIFPTNAAPILLPDGQKVAPKPMIWGFPSFKGKGVIINARGETALDSFQSISNYKRSLRAAFFIAIEDDCIRKNPFSFSLNKVLDDDGGEKTVLTPEQEVSLIDFAQNDPVYQKYADELIILLGTGLRISEFCGLTTNLDFKNRLIQVDHQLLRDSKIGYYIETPKTKNGYREIPMSEPVYRALKRVLKNRGKKATITVDGYTNFLFLKEDGTPRVGINYNSMIMSGCLLLSGLKC